MNINKVWAAFFSATGTTRKVVIEIADLIAEKLGIECEYYDFSLPSARTNVLKFTENELVILGTPVYAGRVPNVLLKYLATIEGNGAAAVPIVLYGNRNYDDGLIELRDILEKDRFHTIAAAAFIGEHSFSDILAKGRPDAFDMVIASNFADKVVEKLIACVDIVSMEHVYVKGVSYPYRGYYQPRDRRGNPIDIRKVKPFTNSDCNNCKICADICPMGSISTENVQEFIGICIKCGACIKNCPKHARYYEDAMYLYHQHELEEELTRRAEPELFL